ncbi:Glycosyltransferase Family 22 protein [Gigaspora rosea]|uniref:Mannosyltransferase n=1 Tax=Gigaspora rosea TaxID=44941 RepID=A0A397UZ93_9GLOM|nr:Glycosyltransferase Family 22 protein [Gigaspora rosea]
MAYDWKNVIIYIFLCFLRLICALSPGYIHPDEFFQSPEIMGGDVFGFEVFRPWEFEQHPQCRSIVIPALTIGLPFKLLKSLNNLRIGMGLTATTPTESQVRIQNMSSSVKEEVSANYAFLLGSLIALGIFTRVTFILYVFPIGVAVLYHVFLSPRTLNKNWTEKFQELIPLAFGIFFISAICVIIDSLYFGTLKLIYNGVVLTNHHIFEFLSNPITLLKVEWQGNLIFTPLNNILYNLDSNNLSEHGLHPRYLHIYNFTLLFGPLVLLTMKDLNVSFNYMRFTAKKRYKTVSVVVVPSDRLQKLPKLFWLAWVIFNAIFTVFFGGYHQAGIIPIIQRLQYQTIGFRNCEEYEGTVRCDIGRKIIRPVVKNSSSETFITNIIFYKTYMPPRHLFCYPEAWRDTNIQVNIHDLAGRPIRILETLLLKQVNPKRQLITSNLMRHIHFQRRVDGNVTLRQYERTLLVTPSTTDLSIFEEHNELHSNSEIKKIELVLIDKYWPHLNFDYLDRVFKHGIYLNVYAVTQR